MTISRGIGGVQTLCIELASIIHANAHVGATVYGIKRKLHMYEDFAEHHEETLKARSIELAVNFRVLDEQLEESPAYVKLKAGIEADAPGAFTAPGKGPLSLRECCNKIIHGHGFKFDLARYNTRDAQSGEDFSNVVKDSGIVVFGEQSGRPWECRIDLLTFAEQVHEVVSRWVYGQFERA